jgi:hypothetical protein
MMKLPLYQFLFLLFFVPATVQSQPALFGTWEFRPAKSTDLALWRSRNPRLDIGGTEREVTIRYTWLEGRTPAMVDSFRVRPGGTASGATVKTRIWPDNWFMGVLAKQNVIRTASAQWQVPLRGLDLTTDQVVETSQGETTIRTLREFRLDPAGGTLTVTERRSSRPTPIIMTFERIPEP